MKIKNLTEHPVIFIYGEGEEDRTTYPPCGRIQLDTSFEVNKIIDDATGRVIKITRIKYGIPDMFMPEFNTIYIVSSMVKAAIKQLYPMIANSFVFPTEVVKDEDGKVVGCKELRL